MSSGQCGEGVYWELDDNGCVHIYGEGKMYDDLSDELKDVREEVCSVVIDEGVTSVASNLFGFCENLTSVKLPGTMKVINGWAFNECKKLEQVNLPDGLEEIGGFAFHQCNSLKSVAIPESITCIGDSVFRACINLTDIKFPSSLESIGVKAFWGCANLGNIQFNEGLKVIEEDAFGAAFADGTEIVLPATLEKLGRGAFSQSYIKRINLAGEMTELEREVFAFCYNLEEVILSNSIQYIGENAFRQCISLKSIIIPDQVYCLELDSFSDCEALETIIIPASVHSFGAHVFRGADKLTIMGYEGSTAHAYAKEKEIPFFRLEGVGKEPDACVVAKGKIGDNVEWTFENTGKLTLFGTGDMYENCTEISHDNIRLYRKYRNAVKEIIITDGITRIGGSAFRDCINVEKVTISDSVTEILGWAFSGCVKLKEIVLPANVKYVGGYAFHDCKMLEKCKVPVKDVRLDENVFFYSDKVILNGYAGGELEKYANDNGVEFKAIHDKARNVPYYNIAVDGGVFEADEEGIFHYYLNDELVRDAFFCDGTYTYYLQYDGSPMRNTLTYHPDGEHVIYFDESGHEVFNNFANVKKTITGDAVDDYCFFDVNGYLYVDVVTYDNTGTVLYYANPYGVIERDKWFEFSDSVKWANGTPFDKAGGQYGYANADGTLMTSQWTYDWEGRYCLMQGNGVALYQ